MELQLTFEEEKKDVASTWDKTVPIVARNGVVTAYLISEVYEPECYSELCYTLEHTEASQVRLVINNGGGRADAMLSIISSMNKCQCEIVGVLSGSVASAATIIALQCDKLEVAPHTSWLTHYYSGGLEGKGNEIEAQYEFEKVHMPRMFKDLHKGFLTDIEMNKVIKGKDLWFGTDEILERFTKMRGSK